MALPARDYITPQEYLARERAAPGKSEYFDGEIFAMAGASWAHNLIVGNLMLEIGSRLLDGPCAACPNDLRVKIAASGLYTYPDVVVVCGEPQFEDAEVDTLLNPTLLIEVLSPSTEAYDRGEKAGHYRRIPSLREYVLVSQDRARVEWYVRDGEGWRFHEVNGLEAVLRLATVPGEIPLARIYNRVELSERLGR